MTLKSYSRDGCVYDQNHFKRPPEPQRRSAVALLLAAGADATATETMPFHGLDGDTLPFQNILSEQGDTPITRLVIRHGGRW